MFIREKLRSTGRTAIQIVGSKRVGEKVVQTVVRHIGQGESSREIEELKRLAQSIIVEYEQKRETSLPLFNVGEIGKKVSVGENDPEKICIKDLRGEDSVVEGFSEVFGKLSGDLGFEHVFSGTRRDAQWNSILKSCVLGRLARPVSKRRTALFLQEEYGVGVPLEKIYRMMDRLADRVEVVKDLALKSTLSLFEEKVDVLFFDVTTLYFESIDEDELREFGFSKDCKFKEVQVVLALITAHHGLPITYELFPGSTFEGHTLKVAVEALKKRFAIANILIVADRGMFNWKNLEWMESEGIRYIVAAKLRSLSKNMKAQILESSLYTPAVVENEFHWIREFTHKEKRRLIVSYSSQRAKRDAKQRQRLVERLENKVKNGKIKVSELVTNRGSKKFLKMDEANAVIDNSKIERDAVWDGIHGIVTNDKTMTVTEALSRYRGLWQIEESFRINKHDLSMRPIFHWRPKRIKAHMAICFMAYTLARQATYRLRLITKQSTSFEELRHQLLQVKSDTLVDISTKNRYRVPFLLTPNQKRIYSAFGLKRSEVPYRIN